MEELNTLPMWAQIALAFGGIELVKWAAGMLINWRSNKRKESAQAKQEEANAGQSDADLRQKELALLNDLVETTKQQYGELKQRYDELLVERKADRQEMADLRREVAELRQALADNEKETGELRRAFDESEAKRKEAERLYCAVADCANRVPLIGTYGSGIKPEEQQVIRDKKGRFSKKADEGKAEV